MPVPPRHLWAIVFSNREVRIVPDIDRLHQTQDEISFAIPPHALQEIMADKPGRTFASERDGRRAAMEYGSDPLAEETRKLLREAIDRLDHARVKGQLKELAVFAEPSALGEWRKLMPEPLADMVVHEEAANLVHLDAEALRKRLRDALGLPPG